MAAVVPTPWQLMPLQPWRGQTDPHLSGQCDKLPSRETGDKAGDKSSHLGAQLSPPHVGPSCWEQQSPQICSCGHQGQSPV